MNDDNVMFDTSMLEEQEIKFKKVVEEPIVSATTTIKSIPVSALSSYYAGDILQASASVEIPDELTLVQTLIEIKTTKPKPITTTATTVTSVRPRAKGIAKDKGKAIIVDLEVPLKKKDQNALDEELALRLHAKEQAELERMQRERVAQEEANKAAIIEEFDSIQAMIERGDN
ncbi:hypothetical protein Tco_0365466 [Tanacetum coccineum]